MQIDPYIGGESMAYRYPSEDWTHDNIQSWLEKTGTSACFWTGIILILGYAVHITKLENILDVLGSFKTDPPSSSIP